MHAILLSDDLLDASRVPAKQCRDLAALRIALVAAPKVVLLDLHHPQCDASVIAECVASSPMVVGFGAHVDVARLKAARAAGCHQVLPRSAFFDKLDEQLRGWLARADATMG